MRLADHTLFDTDIQIHRLSPDRPVMEMAELEFEVSRPVAMSEFSLVELKGNYISYLILLHRKVYDSESLGQTFSRVQNSGGRRAALMLAQLISWLGGVEFPIKPWDRARNLLLTYLDSQIETSWEMFKKRIDAIVNDFNCTRAKEPPSNIGGKWMATIPECRDTNTSCDIVGFMNAYRKELTRLVDVLDSLSSEKNTRDLKNIKKIVEKTLEKNQFPWRGRNCRKAGDLLIGLQSKATKELLSSNYKEHRILQGPLDYTFREFPIAEIRSK